MCNGCNRRRYHCSRRWRCEYSAARAQALADGLLSEARRGVDCDEERFGWMMDRIHADVARGLSPAQIAQGRAGEFKVSASTIYRWVSRGYGGMCSADLRRKVGHRKRRRSPEPKPTAHGEARSYRAFSALPDEERARACEMDTVVGRTRDSRRILTLLLRPFSFQLCLLPPDAAATSAAAALDMLERAAGAGLSARLFGLLLTDNGPEFSDPAAIERSTLGEGSRCRVFYCDARQSQQKGARERNHVELRKLLPKGRGIDFDSLEGRDMAEVMSQLNSEPRIPAGHLPDRPAKGGAGIGGAPRRARGARGAVRRARHDPERPGRDPRRKGAAAAALASDESRSAQTVRVSPEKAPGGAAKRCPEPIRMGHPGSRAPRSLRKDAERPPEDPFG